MSYEHGTPFLNLAQTVGTDHRDWFDENAAKLDLDTKMKTLWDGAADTAEILSTLQENVGNLQTDVTTLEGVVSGHTSTITTINESLVLINTALNALNTQVTNKFDSAGIADPYDATHGTYDVGDVVTYNGQRYVCSTAVTAAEPFDVSKWTAEDVQSVFDNIIPELLITVTGDGVKTTAQVIGELNAALVSSGKTLSKYSYINNRGTILPCNQPDAKIFTNASCTSAFTSALITIINLANSTNGGISITPTETTSVDYSSSIFQNGGTISLYV